MQLVQLVETKENWQTTCQESIETIRQFLIEAGMEHLLPSEEESKKAAKKKLAHIKRKFRILEFGELSNAPFPIDALKPSLFSIDPEK